MGLGPGQMSCARCPSLIFIQVGPMLIHYSIALLLLLHFTILFQCALQLYCFLLHYSSSFYFIIPQIAYARGAPTMFLYPVNTSGGPVPMSTLMVLRILWCTGAALGDGPHRFPSVFTHVTNHTNVKRFHQSIFIPT